MNKKHNLLIVPLVAIFFFSFFASVYKILPTARATYVGGTIVQDTEWTLVDSPFIVSGNIMVNSGVTLTIDPGVQVMFGQNFTIAVYGGIIAEGTDGKTIQFTSDNVNPNTGDWGTILVDGTEQSMVTNCIIEYGTSGITLESGSLNLQNDILTSNSNGITVNGGSIIIMNNQITDNTANGVSIAGGDQITMQNNIISSNGNGVVLSGDLAGNINISQNSILSNGQSGIWLDAEAYINTAILQNNVSSNNYGILVDSNVSTYLTHNYISNNTDGIFYDEGTGHQAHFNDIYNNTMGMDLSSGATVNATYNYWGDASGPFHSFLNPNGKGNPVGGDGVDLEFIFFLSEPIDYNNMPPTAILQTDKTLAAPDESIMFIGTNSYDDGRVDQYFYDFGDGTNSGWTTLSLFNHAYSTVGTYTASLQVMDDFGATSNIATTIITVQDLPPLGVSMTLSSDVTDYAGNVNVTLYVSNGATMVANANVTLFSLKGGSFSQTSGVTDANGQLETTFTAPNVMDVTYVRLIVVASGTGYADGSAYEDLQVLPPLQIQMTTEPSIVKSEATVAMVFQVSGVAGQPVANASLTATADNGTLSANTAMTGADGTVTFNFTAPFTLSPLNVTIAMSAQAPGYANGYNEQTVTVLQNILSVSVTANPASVVSESTTAVNVLVTCDTAPIPEATVTVSSGNMGSFTSTSATTDATGVATFSFTAPQTTTSTINATITASATKSHYIDGTGQGTVSVTPKVLIVHVTADNYTTISEAEVVISVAVTYNLAPIPNANVTAASESGGNFSQPYAITNAQGLATLIFTAPQVNARSDIIITAQGSATGYAPGEDSVTLVANPGNISVLITPASYTTPSGSNITITVSATANSNPVVGAQVNVSSSAGNFTFTVGSTDSNGACTFVFKAPPTNVKLPVVLVANVSKNGYLGNGDQTTINVVPSLIIQSGGGFPWLTMLLIIIPLVAVVIIIVLVKMKVIVVSFGQEGEPE